MSHNSRFAWYNREECKTILPRSALGGIQRIEPPADVERREFSGPCFRCGANAKTPCKHRRFYESQPESQPA